MSPIVLASASERRRRLLSSLNVSFSVAAPEVDETYDTGNPEKTASANAMKKHLWARKRFRDCSIISADTVIDFLGRCVAKPSSMEEAFDFLRAFSGSTHKVLTAVAFSTPVSGIESKVVESSVSFLTLTDERIAEYFKLVNPMDKAGAYDIGQHAGLVIESFSGSLTNIIGLPLEIVADWLSAHGYEHAPPRREK